MLISALLVGALMSPAVAARDNDRFEYTSDSMRVMCSEDMPERGLVAKQWSETVAEHNRLIFNDGSENQFVLVDSDGRREEYRPVTKLTQITNDRGVKYRELGLVNEDLEELTVMLYQDYLSLIHYRLDGSYMIVEYYFA